MKNVIICIITRYYWCDESQEGEIGETYSRRQGDKYTQTFSRETWREENTLLDLQVRWEDNIKMNFKSGCKDTDYMYLI
jgi:hypothetical protein